MKKTLRYNFRLKPTMEQESKLVEFGSYARGLWNLLLSDIMRRYRYDKTFILYDEMAGLIRDLKKFEEFSWLKAFDSTASQQVARDLETALKNSFNKGRIKKFPTFKVSFKQKNLHDDSFRCVNNSNCIRIEKGSVSIPKIGKVLIVLHRKLASKIKTATVQLKHGKWYVSLKRLSARAQNKYYQHLWAMISTVNTRLSDQMIGTLKSRKLLKKYRQN